LISERLTISETVIKSDYFAAYPNTKFYGHIVE